MTSVAAHGGYQSGPLDRCPHQFTWPLPGFNAMQLQPHGFFEHYRDQGRERANMKMTTEHNVERSRRKRVSENMSCVRNLPGPRRCLTNSWGQVIFRARAMPRDD